MTTHAVFGSNTLKTMAIVNFSSRGVHSVKKMPKTQSHPVHPLFGGVHSLTDFSAMRRAGAEPVGSAGTLRGGDYAQQKMSNTIAYASRKWRKIKNSGVREKSSF